MRLAIFGATGLLGKALIRHSAQHEVVGLSSQNADIRDANQVNRVLEKTRPNCVILAAAYTDVDGCETNSDLAFDVNCQGAINVAQAAKHVGSKLLFISTDYVFDGTKSQPYETDDARNPQSVYGRSKAKAEVELLRTLPDCCIVRTSWLFGVGGKCFPDTILKLAATRPELEVVNDQRGSPTYAPDLADAIMQLCQIGATGIIHATNGNECTWFEFAHRIVADAGLHTAVKPTRSDKFVRPAPRPKYSVLSPRSLEKHAISMPPWEDALSRYLQQRALPSEK